MAKFQTSARAIDMLGRQQIAGIPTAVSELFKNAYDAYATAVRADYFPDRRVLLLRDNGIGMSEVDFMGRWLTIATDSKTADGLISKPAKPNAIATRKQMGEKGIGRLAIASIGPQLLIATRSMAEPNAPVVTALVQWSMFEAPGLTLDDVVVPLRLVERADQLDADVLASMREELLAAIDDLGERISPERRVKIRGEVNSLSIDPRPFFDMHGPSLAKSPGTAFLVTPVREEMDTALATPDGREDVSISSFQRFLSGFTNTMTGHRDGPELGARFMVHDHGTVRDLIGSTQFWVPEDFDSTDHMIEGEFDERGAFHGFASIYGASPIEFTEPWTPGRGRTTKCGPFKLKFGYVQGEASDSRLSAEEWALMTAKLKRIGGLYVYRDGIRVLPYGNSDYDYLEIEQRRTLKASRYFFSYRRMFGAVDVASGLNPALQEKAGREGFRENGAYSDFKAVMQNLLVQTAATFFSKDGAQGERWTEERERLKRRASARAAQEASDRRARDRFATQLEEILEYIESGNASRDIEDRTLAAERALAAMSRSSEPSDLIAAEDGARRSLAEVVTRADIRKPSTLALTSDLERDWLSYERLRSSIDGQLGRAGSRIAKGVQAAVSRVGDPRVASQVDAGRRAALRELAAGHQASISGLEADVDNAAARLGDAFSEAAAAEVRSFEIVIEKLLEPLDSNLVVPNLEEMVENVTTAAEQHRSALEQLSEKLHEYLSIGVGSEDRRVLEEQVLDLQEQIDANLELMQLGLAVQIVSHEFESSIKAVRRGLQDLGPWARSTPRLAPVVRDLRASFAHLDGYLKLFTPLQRRLYRQSIVISGSEIADFVDRVFADRLARHDIHLEVTDTFRSWRLKGFPSTFYPVFVNLVDNAIHWTSSEVQDSGRITLDADDASLYVRDNGPGVQERDRVAIFERGFSRRRGGRGLGLAISAELLEREGWRLSYDALWSAGGAFAITRENSSVEEKGNEGD